MCPHREVWDTSSVRLLIHLKCARLFSNGQRGDDPLRGARVGF